MPTDNDLPNNLNSMTCAQLKDLLKLRDLPVSGNKAELIQRLKDFMQQLARKKLMWLLSNKHAQFDELINA